ncbi:uncharacterized protein LOC108830745 [Raphanus sativus]|uniref:Uncharacterized protein LOC108830745 n=1 Tax=Raphanus sativus TaxID=3726 RepID=A0A6J0LJI9_RAPSA|nr:uncharacterized protein LOC108830745 [Raphanus sativus]
MKDDEIAARNLALQEEEEEERLDEYDEKCEKENQPRWSVPAKKRVRGPLDKYVTVPPPDILQGRKDRKSTLGASCDKALREDVCLGITRWFLDAGLAFNAVNYPSFDKMLQLIAQYGLGLKPPSMYELRVPLLNKEVENTLDQNEENKKGWASKGSSLMSDGWRDSVAKKDNDNFLLNSPKDYVFMKSKDVSEVVKDATLLFNLLDDMVEKIGEPYVVQVITDNAKNYIKAEKLLEAKRHHLYRTPCAAHCINLMLEDIGEITELKNAMKKCMFMNGYIYSHVPLVNMMRKFTKQRNLHRPAITRFPTSCITMTQFLKQQKPLRDMVNSAE